MTNVWAMRAENRLCFGSIKYSNCVNRTISSLCFSLLLRRVLWMCCVSLFKHARTESNGNTSNFIWSLKFVDIFLPEKEIEQQVRNVFSSVHCTLCAAIWNVVNSRIRSMCTTSYRNSARRLGASTRVVTDGKRWTNTAGNWIGNDCALGVLQMAHVNGDRQWSKRFLKCVFTKSKHSRLKHLRALFRVCNEFIALFDK